MEKKYQVFVSSTYEDLQEERKKVMEALLQMNCFPVGMEYFNASDSSQWDVIKSLIRECDYYILIVAGRYGSIEEESEKSYTQKEFEYAIEQGVPVISFVHKNPEILPGIKIESNPKSKDKLKIFKSDVKKKLCKLWDNADGLASQVVLSLNSLIKTDPRIGWVKADEISSAEANKEILTLRSENEELLLRVKELEVSVPDNFDELEHGDEEFTIRYTIYDSFANEYKEFKIEMTWNAIFLLLASELLAIKPIAYISIILRIKLGLPENALVNEEDTETIIIQLISLGLVKSKVLDGGDFNCLLSARGRHEMFRLRVRKKK